MKRITIAENGPYLVEGHVPLADQHIVTNEQGESVEWREGKAFPAAETYALCRCGGSRTKPFCDGTHAHVGFDGTEVASHDPYAAHAERIDGPSMILEDAAPLCAGARFCDRHGRIWNLIKKSDEPHSALLVEREAGRCPGGRLVATRRATGEALEPKFEPSLGLVQDSARATSGPLWVRGGIPVIGAEGHTYEVRNRVALCRCGASSNKPFCDGSHVAARFDDKS